MIQNPARHFKLHARLRVAGDAVKRKEKLELFCEPGYPCSTHPRGVRGSHVQSGLIAQVSPNGGVGGKLTQRPAHALHLHPANVASQACTRHFASDLLSSPVGQAELGAGFHVAKGSCSTGKALVHVWLKLKCHEEERTLSEDRFLGAIVEANVENLPGFVRIVEGTQLGILRVTFLVKECCVGKNCKDNSGGCGLTSKECFEKQAAVKEAEPKLQIPKACGQHYLEAILTRA